MQDYLERVAATLGAVFRKFLFSSDFELALYLAAAIVISIAFLALCIGWLRNKQKKKRHFLLERELHRVQETDDTGNRTEKTVIDAFRIRFPSDNPPQKKTAVEDQTDTTDEEAERRYYEEKRG
jgi:hypothetical protein